MNEWIQFTEQLIEYHLYTKPTLPYIKARDIFAARNVHFERQLDKTAMQMGESIGNILEKLGESDLSYLEQAATFFFWGKEYEWKEDSNRMEWTETLKDLAEGPTVLEGFSLECMSKFSKKIADRLGDHYEQGDPVLRGKRTAGGFEIQHPLNHFHRSAIFPPPDRQILLHQSSFWDSLWSRHTLGYLGDMALDPFGNANYSFSSAVSCM